MAILATDHLCLPQAAIFTFIIHFLTKFKIKASAQQKVVSELDFKNDPFF